MAKNKINRKRREKIKKLGKTLMTAAAVTLLPSIVKAGTVEFKSKSQSNATLQMTNDGKVKIGNSGTLASYASAPTLSGTNILGYDGYLYANKVYNSVWNDLADFRKLAEGQKKEPGKVYVSTENGLVQATKRAQKGVAGVCSDSYGFALGGDDNDKSKAPIAISGWVLAYVDKKYEIGTALVSAPNGVLTKASWLEKLLYPERVVGTVEISPKEYNKVKVDGRYWVKVK